MVDVRDIQQIQHSVAASAKRVTLVDSTGTAIGITSGAIDVNVNGVDSFISTANSTSTPLGIDGVFTGTAEDVSNYSSVAINIISDQASATDGMSLEFSSDGTNWDHQHAHSVSANEFETILIPVHAQYYRIVYTNGGTGQGSFRLQSIFKTINGHGVIHKIEEAINDDDLAQITKTVITGENPGGTYMNVQTTTAGNMKVSVEEFDPSVFGQTTMSSSLPVAIASDQTWTGATNLGKAEDAVHASGDTGVMALGVRRDLPATQAADGDYTTFLTSDVGGLWTEHVPNEVDSGNSSTSTLTSGSTFTGTAVDDLEFDFITVTVDASHDSATDGMTFQFSTDNSNWDDIYLFTYTAADGARRFQFPVTAQYFRVVYTNGGTGQSHFRLQTLKHHGSSITSIHRLVDDVGNDRSAQIVKAAIIAQQGGGGPGAGDFIAVQATAGGNLRTSVQEISDGLDIGAGNAGSETQRVSISTDDVNLSGILADTAAIDTATAASAASLAIMDDWDNAASDGASMSGDTAHDAVDAGEPVKIGGIATDYEPDTDDEQGASEVAAADRTNTAHNLRGERIEGVNPFTTLLDNINVTYDASPTSATSQEIECWNYRKATISFDITESGTATDIEIDVQISLDGSNWMSLVNGGLGKWIYDDSIIGSEGGTLSRAYTFDICAYMIRVFVNATGTDGSNSFTMANAYLYMRN